MTSLRCNPMILQIVAMSGPGNALDDMQPPIGPPILQQPPAPIPFDFASFMRRSGGNTTSLLSVIREADAQLPPGPIVNVLEELRGQYYAY